MAKSKSSNSRSKVKTIVFKSDFMIDAPPKIFSDVEREIILADMAYLKQKDIDSGAQAIWDADQAKWKNFNAMRRAVIIPDDYIPPARPETNRDEWGAVTNCHCARCRMKRRR
jgi:hypothetical protein